MSFIQKFAVRNVGRNKRRSLLAVISVTLSILLIVFLQGLIGGFLITWFIIIPRMKQGMLELLQRNLKKKQNSFL